MKQKEIEKKYGTPFRARPWSAPLIIDGQYMRMCYALVNGNTKNVYEKWGIQISPSLTITAEMFPS